MLNPVLIASLLDATTTTAGLSDETGLLDSTETLCLAFGIGCLEFRLRLEDSIKSDGLPWDLSREENNKIKVNRREDHMAPRYEAIFNDDEQAAKGGFVDLDHDGKATIGDSKQRVVRIFGSTHGDLEDFMQPPGESSKKYSVAIYNGRTNPILYYHYRTGQAPAPTTAPHCIYLQTPGGKSEQ